jgi:hypothetical protein
VLRATWQVKRAFYHVLNDKSKKATYDLCVIKFYKGDEMIEDHSDTRHAEGSEVANVDGAAVLSVYVGADMELWTRRLGKGTREHATDLLGGGAFCWDAGAPGSDDYVVDHSVHPRDDAQPSDLRIAFVFRAMKREYGREFAPHWPHKSVL